MSLGLLFWLGAMQFISTEGLSAQTIGSSSEVEPMLSAFNLVAGSEATKALLCSPLLNG